MKKIVLCVLALLPALVWAQVGTNLNIKIKVGTLDAPAKAFLFYRSADTSRRDSVIANKGEFIFNVSVAEPQGATVVIDHKGAGFDKLRPTTADMLTFYIEKGAIGITASDSIKNATVTGSPASSEFLNYKKLTTAQDKAMSVISLQYQCASEAQKKDTVFTNTLHDKYFREIDTIKLINEKYIRANPDSYVSVELLNQVIGDDLDVAKITPIYGGLSVRMRNSIAGKKIGESIENARKTGIGAMAPVFTMNDVNDKPVTLTDFRGKYVLLDFWASWCGPCRAENPNVLKAYKNYKSKNFTVLGVSLDQMGKKVAWLKAIKDDGLEWTQVSDLSFWNNAAAKKYNVRAIPQNFLIDPSGKIVAKDLRGDNLNNKLKELLGN
jgi:peroxiredoxin